MPSEAEFMRLARLECIFGATVKDHEERRRVRVKADATFHPHTGCEACQRRCTLRTATLLVFPP